MNNDVLKLWAVVDRGDDPVPTSRFIGPHKTDAVNRLTGDTKLAEVTLDFRNWEPVDAQHPLTQEDNGCAVRVNGLEAGVIDDREVNGLGVWVRRGGSACLCGTKFITHVARPPKPPRKTIEWGRLATYSTGKINGEIVATIVVVSNPIGAVATVIHDGKLYSSMFNSSNWDAAAAMNWCERVVNGEIEK